jgi:hypothetical protein
LTLQSQLNYRNTRQRKYPNVGRSFWQQLIAHFLFPFLNGKIIGGKPCGLPIVNMKLFSDSSRKDKYSNPCNRRKPTKNVYFLIFNQ